MRVILLTHYYPPEAGAPQRRWEAVVRGLVERGVEVTVHTGFPHYPDGRISPPYTNRPWSVAELDGVKVVRSAVAGLANRGFAPRLADHAAFAASSLATGRVAGPADVVIVESPPLFLAGSGVAYARAKRARLVLNVSDLWPESAVELGALRRSRLVGAAAAVERFAYRHADAITVPTAGMAASLERRAEAAGKVWPTPPSVDCELFAADPPVRSGPLRVLYAGTVAMAQGLEDLVGAARLAGPDVVRVTIAGGGALLDEVRRAVGREGAENVSIIGSVAPEAVPGLYAEADVGLVTLRDRPVLRGALPTKILECMAAGRPVLLSAAGEAAEFVRHNAAGVVVEPESAHALAEGFRQLHDAGDQQFAALSAAARLCAEGHDRGKSLDRWESLLVRVVSAQSSD